MTDATHPASNSLSMPVHCWNEICGWGGTIADVLLGDSDHLLCPKCTKAVSLPDSSEETKRQAVAAVRAMLACNGYERPIQAPSTEIVASDHTTWPYELQRAIGDEHRSIGESNNCEHRPTYQSQLDRATNAMVAEYLVWMEFQKTTPAEGLSRAHRYWEATYKRNCWGHSGELRSVVAGGRRMLAPRYVDVFDEAKKLREVLA